MVHVFLIPLILFTFALVAYLGTLGGSWLAAVALFAVTLVSNVLTAAVVTVYWIQRGANHE